jgi:predicted GIY-YIG superfamily endonuclease
LKKKIRAGVIGLGVGAHHAKILSKHPKTDLVWLCDFDKKKLMVANEYIDKTYSQPLGYHSIFNKIRKFIETNNCKIKFKCRECEKARRKIYYYTDSFNEEDTKHQPLIDYDLKYTTINKKKTLIYVVISKQLDNSLIKYATYYDNDILKTIKISKDENLESLYSTKSLSIKVTIPELSDSLAKEYSIKGWNNYEDDGLKGTITILGNSTLTLLDVMQLKLESEEFINNPNLKDNIYNIEEIETSITENDGFLTKITLGGRIK